MPNHRKLKLTESQVLTSMWNYLISYTPLHPYKIVNKGTGNESAKLDHQYLCTVKWKWSYTILKHSPHVGLNKPELLFCVLANLRPGFPLVNVSRGKPKTHVRGMRAMLKFGLTAGYVLAFVSRLATDISNGISQRTDFELNVGNCHVSVKRTKQRRLERPVQTSQNVCMGDLNSVCVNNEFEDLSLSCIRALKAEWKP